MQPSNDFTPQDVPPNVPPLPKRARKLHRIWYAPSLIPAVLLLIFLIWLSIHYSGHSGPAILGQQRALSKGLTVLMLATPVILLPWSYLLLRAKHGPVPAGERWSRRIKVLQLTLASTVVNYAIGWGELTASLVLKFILGGFVVG